jgi:hypothetical protein
MSRAIPSFLTRGFLPLAVAALAPSACGESSSGTNSTAVTDTDATAPDAAPVIDSASAPDSSPASDADTDPCSDLAITPGGPIARTCVHEVPSGAFVAPDDAGNTVIVVDGSVIATYPPCPCARDASIGPQK